MLDDGQEIKRANLATSLNTMMGAGRYEDALQIFKKNTEAPTSNNINDTNFVLLAQSRDIPYYRPFPFDWTRHQKRGLQISAYESIGDAEVKLRWDGRGAPLMLSQYVNVEVGKNYNLVLTGLDATENIVKRLQFFLNCKSGIVRFDQGRKDIKTNQLILSSDSTPSCAFPRLEIRGRIQEVRRPNEISLSSLNLLASE